MSTASVSNRRISGWRKPILQHFTPEIAAVTPLTIVSDPDLLLTEQEILDALRVRGYALIPFDDPVAFRFAYESRYRQIWDRSEQTDLAVVLRTKHSDLNAIPYDLLEQARRNERCLNFTVGELFPRLAPNVVSELDRSTFEALFEAQKRDDSERLGENTTKDFILRHVFELIPELIKTPVDLMRVLLRRHYRDQRVPASLDERFISLLQQRSQWREWPLGQIVPSRAAFLEFLDERWPYFVEQELFSDNYTVAESVETYSTKIPGPVEIPFGHDDVKIYIDDLFQEGQLTPIEIATPRKVLDTWMRVGVVGPKGSDRVERYRRLFRRLKDNIPQSDSDHRSWINYARTWSEWSALRWSIGDEKAGVPKEECEHLQDAIENVFIDWMQGHYASMHNLSYVHGPVMVHHIAHYIAHQFTPTGTGVMKKFALVVVDGLALDQWVVLRHALSNQLGPQAQIADDAVFAWVPTLTSISRQAIFAGDPPFLFSTSLGSTYKEKAHWQRFWEDRGAKKVEIGYICEGKNEPDDVFLQRVREVAEHPKMRLLGVVVGKIDQSIHGVVTGNSGLHSIVRDWAKNGAMAQLLQSLLVGGYQVYVTADHGNIMGYGIGKPKVGAVADERGTRVHIFPDELVRSQVQTDYPGSIPWPQIGLPEEYRALLAPGRGAFIPVGKSAIGHGGIAMEEVIVPFVSIKKRHPQ